MRLLHLSVNTRCKLSRTGNLSKSYNPRKDSDIIAKEGRKRVVKTRHLPPRDAGETILLKVYWRSFIVFGDSLNWKNYFRGVSKAIIYVYPDMLLNNGINREEINIVESRRWFFVHKQVKDVKYIFFLVRGFAFEKIDFENWKLIISYLISLNFISTAIININVKIECSLYLIKRIKIILIISKF